MRPTRWEPLARNEREARTVEALKSEEPSVRRVRARAPALPVSDLLRSARDFGQGQAVKSLVYELWRTVEFWDVATGTLKKSLTGHSKSVTAVAFSPDGKTLVSGSDDMTVKLWNVP